MCFREKVDKGFIDACVYVKDRMEEVSSPDKEMVNMFLYRRDVCKRLKKWVKIEKQIHFKLHTAKGHLWY